jgi:hypothetical protein
MSTEECKALLEDEYPDLNSKDWKRISKYNNIMGNPVRHFKHPSNGDVWIVEDDEELDLYDDFSTSYVRKAADIAPASYLFSIDTSFNVCSRITINFTLVDFFAAEQCMDDRHDMVPGIFLPKEWDAHEETEGIWSVAKSLTPDAIIARMHKLGFQRSDAFDELTGGASSALTMAASHDSDGPSF